MSALAYEIANKDQMHAEAVRTLNEMGVCTPLVKDFEHNDRVYLFKNYEGFRIHPDSTLAAKIHEIEQKYGHKVFGITYEKFSFGRIYSFLLVSKYRDDWRLSFDRLPFRGRFRIFAYCWNLDKEEYSEYGSVIIDSAIGGIRRVG